MAACGHNANAVTFAFQLHWMAGSSGEFVNVVLADSYRRGFVGKVQIKVVDLLTKQHRRDAPASDDRVFLNQTANRRIINAGCKLVEFLGENRLDRLPLHATMRGIDHTTCLSSITSNRGMASALRSEERRVGNECVSTCRYRWLPDN